MGGLLMGLSLSGKKRRTHNPGALGSNPRRPTIFKNNSKGR